MKNKKNPKQLHKPLFSFIINYLNFLVNISFNYYYSQVVSIMKNKQAKHFQLNKKTAMDKEDRQSNTQEKEPKYYMQNTVDWQAQSPKQKVTSAGRAASNDRARYGGSAAQGQAANNPLLTQYMMHQGQPNALIEDNQWARGQQQLLERRSDGAAEINQSLDIFPNERDGSLGGLAEGRARILYAQGSPKQGPLHRQGDQNSYQQPVMNSINAVQKQELNLRANLLNDRKYQSNSKSTGRQPNKMNHIQLINTDQPSSRNGSTLRPVVTGGQFRKGKTFKKQVPGQHQYGSLPHQIMMPQQRNTKVPYQSSRQVVEFQGSQTSLQPLANLNAKDYKTDTASTQHLLKNSYNTESQTQPINFQQIQTQIQSEEQSYRSYEQQTQRTYDGTMGQPIQRQLQGHSNSNTNLMQSQPIASNRNAYPNANELSPGKFADICEAELRATNNSYENDRAYDRMDDPSQDNQEQIQVLSKKLISFRSQSKDDEETSGLHPEGGEQRDRSNRKGRALGSARADPAANGAGGQNQAAMHQAVQRNQFSTLGAGNDPNQNAQVDPKSFNRSQPIKMPNINGLAHDPNNTSTNQLTPGKGTDARKEDAANSARVPAGHPGANGSGKPSRGAKIPRLISGHPQRRLPQQKSGANGHQQTSQQSGSTGRQGPTKPNHALGAPAQAAPHALQGFTRRRQPQHVDAAEEPSAHALHLAQSLRTNLTTSKRNAHMTNSLQSSQPRNGSLQVVQGQNQASQQALQTIPMATLDALSLNSQANPETQGSREALNSHTVMNTATNSTGRHAGAQAKPKVQKGASLPNTTFQNPGTNPEPGSFPLNNVIYHPHPLNNNIQNGNGMPMNQLAAQGTIQNEPARPQSQKQNQATALNNRNSRKNLKPLGKKPSQTSNQNNNAAHKATKGQNTSGQLARNQANSAKQTNALTASLNLQLIQAEMSVSTSRERALALGGVNFATNSSSQRTKNPTGGHQDSYQSQSTSNQGANIANMNALFKFKKNTQANRGQQQQAGVAPGGTADSQNAASTASRRPIIVRKNNYLTQQQQQQIPAQQLNMEQSSSAQNLRANAMGVHSLHQNRQQAILQQHLTTNQQPKYPQVQGKNQQQLKQNMQIHAQQSQSSHKVQQQSLVGAMASNQSQDGRKYFKINNQGREVGLGGGLAQQPMSQFKPSQTVAFGSSNGAGTTAGLGELAGLTGLMACSTGSDNLGGDGSQISQGKELTANTIMGGEVKCFQAPLLRHNNSNDALQSSSSYPLQTQQVQTARQNNKGSKFKENTQKIDLKQTTMLGNLTQNFKNLQSQNQSKLLIQSSDQTLQSNSQSNLQLSQSNNNKLIKVNKSKKILETARRSRIQQLDKDNYNTQGNAGLNQLNLVALNSNGAPPQYLGGHGHHLISSATNKSTKGKKLNSLNVQNPNFKNAFQANNTQRQQQIQIQPKKQAGMMQQQLGASSQSSIQQANLESTYTNQSKQSQQANNQINKVQLNMNIKMNPNQFTCVESLQGIKQAHSQKNNPGIKLNVLSASNPKALIQQQNQNTLSYTQQPNLEPVLGHLNHSSLPNQPNSNEKSKQASNQSYQMNVNSMQAQAAERSCRISSSARNGAQLPSQLRENQTANTEMTSKDREANGAKVDNSQNEVINITSSSKTQANLEAGVSNEQILGQYHFANQEMDAELNAYSAQRQQQILYNENERQNSQLKEASNQKSKFAKNANDEDARNDTVSGKKLARSNETLARVAAHVDLGQASQTELLVVKAENQKEQVKDAEKLNLDQMVNREAGAEANVIGLAVDGNRTRSFEEHADLNHETSKPYQEQAKHAEGSKTNAKQIELNDISEEDRMQELEEGADEEADGAPAMDCAKNEYEPNQTTQNLHKKVTQTKKVLQVQNKVTDQRTTMDTNSNRKQTTDSQQRTNFNTSMQNIPRGIINTAFSLNSAVSRDEVPPLPTTPQNILKYYIHELTDYEKGEILDYDMIYFLGKSRDKKADGMQLNQHGEKGQHEQNTDGSANQNHQSSKSSSQQKDGKEGAKDQYTHNYGYDDDKGDYKIVIGDHIGYRYEIVEFLGKGSFGTALRCIDHKEKRELAVKIVKNKKKYYYQASVELKILQYLRQHDQEDIMNVIHIEDYVVFRKHLCMAFELLSMNLFEFLKINDFNGFDHNLIRRFAIQLLYALKYLKQLEIIHCDLKPENILLKEENKSGIKIIDFGSSTFVDEKVYTYIQSRFYRAPEIMLGIPYTPAIDMWSLGCIMAELYIGYPLFPGESENDQMSRIMEMRDVPPTEVLKISERKMKFFLANQETHTLEPIMLKNSRGKLRKPNGKPLDYVIGDEDPDFNDFVTKCLDWNPNTRITPDEALKHVWVLKGLPPQVLIHHQKMHNIATPELPESVKFTRDEFLMEQQREQELLRQQQKRITRAQKPAGQENQAQGRDISQNPNVQRPHAQLKTPRSAFKANTTNTQAQNIKSTANLNKSSENNQNAVNINESGGTSSAQKAHHITTNNYPGTARTLPGGEAASNAQKIIPQTVQHQSKKANFNQTLGALPRAAAGVGDVSHNKQPKQLLRTEGSAGTIQQPREQVGGPSAQPGAGAARRKFLVKKAKNEGPQQ